MEAIGLTSDLDPDEHMPVRPVETSTVRVLPARVRTAFTATQISALKRYYAMCRQPDRLLRQTICGHLGLSQKVVRVWFQNQRCKERKLRLQTGREAAKANARKKYLGEGGIKETDRTSPTSLEAMATSRADANELRGKVAKVSLSAKTHGAAAARRRKEQSTEHLTQTFPTNGFKMNRHYEKDGILVGEFPHDNVEQISRQNPLSLAKAVPYANPVSSRPQGRIDVEELTPRTSGKFWSFDKTSTPSSLSFGFSFGCQPIPSVITPLPSGGWVRSSSPHPRGQTFGRCPPSLILVRSSSSQDNSSGDRDNEENPFRRKETSWQHPCTRSDSVIRLPSRADHPSIPGCPTPPLTPIAKVSKSISSSIHCPPAVQTREYDVSREEPSHVNPPQPACESMQLTPRHVRPLPISEHVSVINEQALVIGEQVPVIRRLSNR